MGAAKDPVGLLGGHNLYLYANNNPINDTDPLGLFSWGALGAAVVAGAAAAALVVFAPAVATVAVVAIGALALGAVIGVGISEYQSIGHFCWPCFWKGAKAAAPAAFGIGLLVGAAAVLCPPLGAALIVGGAIYGTYALFDAHFGWSGGKPFDQMTDKEKSEHLGGLVGGTVAGLAGGLIGGYGAGALVRAFRGPTPTTGEGGTTKPTTGAAQPKNLDELYGATEKPGGPFGVKDFETNSDGTVVKNPTIQYPEPGKPPVLEPGKDYIWLVDKDGRLVVAEEVPTGGTLPNGRPQRLGHPTLVDGEPARIGGEIKPQSDGTTTINNRSGRYSGHADRGAEQLNNAAKLFEESGMPVTPDYSPPR